MLGLNVLPAVAILHQILRTLFRGVPDIARASDPSLAQAPGSCRASSGDGRPRLRILHLAFDDPRRPGSGGGAIRSHEINRRLAPRHEITAVTVNYRGARERVEDGVRYVQAGLPLGYYGSILSYFAALPFVIWKHRSDLVVEDFAAPFGSWLVPLWTRRPVIAQVQWFSAREKSSQYHLPFFMFERWGVLLHRVMITVSKGVADRLREINPNADIVVLPNGVEESVWRLEQPVRRRDALYLGRLEMVGKGLNMLLEAFALIATHTDSNLVIAGDGPDRDAILGLADHLGVGSRVKLLGRVSGRHRFELLARAQVVCMPSRYESFGLVALEAMACGTPVLAFDIPCLRELLPSEAATTVPAFDVASYSRALHDLLADPERCRRMGELGRRAARGFDWQRIANQQEELYVKTTVPGSGAATVYKAGTDPDGASNPGATPE